ncbi:MAG: four helix bundle protein [Anaerolineales bacterium]|nr:four helix bundle protein [Anaerolineales bacterium]
MTTEIEELEVLKTAEVIADEIWREVHKWKQFERDVLGKQLARAGDSIGANIAEAYGRYHYGEKIRFLYYARGSLLETKYWLNRALSRKLLDLAYVEEMNGSLTKLARQLNSFIRKLRRQRGPINGSLKKVREGIGAYMAGEDP